MSDVLTVLVSVLVSVLSVLVSVLVAVVVVIMSVHVAASDVEGLTVQVCTDLVSLGACFVCNNVSKADSSSQMIFS